MDEVAEEESEGLEEVSEQNPESVRPVIVSFFFFSFVGFVCLFVELCCY